MSESVKDGTRSRAMGLIEAAIRQQYGDGPGPIHIDIGRAYHDALVREMGYCPTRIQGAVVTVGLLRVAELESRLETGV